MGKYIKLHLLQWEVIPGDVERNIGKVEKLLNKAGPGKGDIAVLPEMFASGFFYETLDDVSRRSGEILSWMSETARRYGTGITGSLATRAGGDIANTMVFIDADGEILGRYDKIHLFPGTGEDRYFAAGDRAVTVIYEDIKAGLAVCFDLRFPELTRRLSSEGALIVLVSAQWPMSRIGHFKELVRVRAMENQMFVAACNSCGKDGSGMLLGGGSMVAAPSGEISGVLDTEEGVLSLRLPLSEVTREREEFPVLKCRRKDIFGEG